MDVGPAGTSLAGEVSHGNVVVLRSFGKFFGLAGLRLGFALASPAVAARLRAALGPWAVSGNRRSPSAPRRSRTRRGSSGRGAGWRAPRVGSMPSSSAPVSRSSAAQACSGWCRRRRPTRYFVTSGVPEFLRGSSRTMQAGCASACRRMSAHGVGSRWRWLPFDGALRFQSLGAEQNGSRRPSPPGRSLGRRVATAPPAATGTCSPGTARRSRCRNGCESPDWAGPCSHRFAACRGNTCRSCARRSH